MAYNFTTEWVKGALNHAPDALSQNPVSDPQTQDMLIECDDCSSSETTIAEIRAIVSQQQESMPLQTWGTGS